MTISKIYGTAVQQNHEFLLQPFPVSAAVAPLVAAVMTMVSMMRNNHGIFIVMRNIIWVMLRHTKGQCRKGQHGETNCNAQLFHTIQPPFLYNILRARKIANTLEMLIRIFLLFHNPSS